RVEGARLSTYPASRPYRYSRSSRVGQARSGGREILARECAIDAERGTRALRRRDDRELHVADDVAGHEHAGNARRFELPTQDSTMARVLAAERVGERRLRARRRVEEQTFARDAFAVIEDHRSQPSARAFERRHALLDHRDPIAPKLGLLARGVA